MEWFRWYHGACCDAKWPIVARKAGVTVGVVVSVWVALLEHASQDEERGSVERFDCETFDALYGYEEGTCEHVITALTEKGLIRDNRIVAWETRQPVREREDVTATERKRRERERKQQEKQEVSPNDVTPLSHHVTPCHTAVTPPDKIREEKKEETTPLPLRNRRGCCAGESAGSLVGRQNPREAGTNARALGINPRALGTNPQALGTNPRALGTNPRAKGTNPRARDAPSAPILGSTQEATAGPSPGMPEKRTETAFPGAETQNVIQGKGESENDPEKAFPCETPFRLPNEMGMDFQQFLDAYPPERREPAGEAVAVWCKLAKAKKLPGLPRLLDGITAWERSAQWQKDNGKYIPKAANFLRNCMWLSAPPPANPKMDCPTLEELEAPMAHLIDISAVKEIPPWRRTQ